MTKEQLFISAKKMIDQAVKEVGLRSVLDASDPREVMSESEVDRFTEAACALSVDDMRWLVDQVMFYRKDGRGERLGDWLEMHLEEMEIGDLPPQPGITVGVTNAASLFGGFGLAG